MNELQVAEGNGRPCRKRTSQLQVLSLCNQTGMVMMTPLNKYSQAKDKRKER